MKGRVYLLVERTGRGGQTLRVTSHRMTKPSHGAAEGVWVELDLDVPESAFQPYQASLTLPENDLTGTVTVLAGEGEPEIVDPSNPDDPTEEE